MNKSRKFSAPKSKPKPKPQNQQSKATTSKKSKSEGREPGLHELPLELQQLLLNVFENAFAKPNSRPLAEVVQEVKGHLYNRDFSAAFGKDEYLHAYAARWSTSRALGYLRLLNGIFKDHFDDVVSDSKHSNGSHPIKITCLGGGAGAELVAMAGVVQLRSKELTADYVNDAVKELDMDESSQFSSVRIEAVFLDIADWGAVIDTLHRGVTTQPPLSTYASAAAKAANKPLISSTSFKASFEDRDVLAMSEEDVRAMSAGQNLITLFFTLNELYTTSMPKTQAFLLSLTNTVGRGTLLFVVDSAGSYSTVALSGQEKKYPMHWLLDHALLNLEQVKGQKEADAKWKKLQERESEWFRIPEGLKFPLDLENMRYQLHLYLRL